MSAILNLSQIKRDADDVVELPTLLEKAQRIVDRFYPGHKIVIVGPQMEAQVDNQERPALKFGSSDFLSLSGVRQIQAILTESPMAVGDLVAELARRGSEISKPTVQSTLSRKKDLFKNEGGKWSAVDVFSTQPQ